MTPGEQVAAVYLAGVPAVAVLIGIGNRRIVDDVPVSLALVWPIAVPVVVVIAFLIACEELADWIVGLWP